MNMTRRSCLLLSGILVVLAGCRDGLLDPFSPEALAGDYSLLSFTNKRDKMHYPAGIPVDAGGGRRLSLTGNLNLTTRRFTLATTWKTFGSDTLLSEVTEVVVGNYWIDDSLFKVVEDSSGRRDAIPITVTVDGLILEDVEFKFVYQKD
ncbi:MAG: hypothetical protein ACE5IY_13060 [bacterium]